MGLINIPGLEFMDSESRAQAVQSSLISELEKLVKVVEGVNVVLGDLQKRLVELENARIAQKVLNAELIEKTTPKVEVKVEPKVELVVKPKNPVAVLLNLFKRKR